MMEVKIAVPTGEARGEEQFDSVIIRGENLQDLVKNVLDWVASDIVENCDGDEAVDYADSLSQTQVVVTEKGDA